MSGRPYWSGQLKISLVAFGIQLFPAIKPESSITFHQIDRASGHRIHHLNVVDDNEPVKDSEIVKGYEYSKGKYLIVEPDEVSKLRIETKSVIEVRQFVVLEELEPALFEKPYFVVPDPKESPEAFVILHKAMEQTGKAALGEVAFGGREHLVAIAVPSDRTAPGLMAYLLRYGEELLDTGKFFSDRAHLKKIAIDKMQLGMAVQLVESYSRPLSLDEYKDDYESGLRKLIEAKKKNAPLPVEEARPRTAKVVNLMDALRGSLSHAKPPASATKRAPKAPAKEAPVSVGRTQRKHKAA